LCAKGAVNGLQTTLQGKAGCPITVMDDCEQFNTNSTLLKPAKQCYSFVMKKPLGKTDLAIYSYSVVVSG